MVGVSSRASWGCVVRFALVLWLAGAADCRRDSLSSGSALCPCASLTALGRHSVPQVPQDYGIGCAPHTKNRSTCSGENFHYCGHSWCYINQSLCTRATPNQTNNPFALEVRELPTYTSQLIPPREYSYETCGYMGSETYELAGFLSSFNLRVVYMTNSGGWKGSYCTTNHTECTGTMAMFLNQVMQQGGVTKEDVFIHTGGGFMNESWWPGPLVKRQVFADNPSETSYFNMCVYATAMGYVDMCIGAFSITSKRMELSRFIPIFNEPLVLAARHTHIHPTFWEYMATPFKPFHWKLWLAILGTICTMAIIFSIDDFLNAIRTGNLNHRSWCRILGFAFYRSFMSVVSASDIFQHTTMAARCASIGFGFFILVLVTSYTAELASGLTLEQLSLAGLNSLSEVVERKVRICLMANHVEGLRFAAPGVLKSSLFIVYNRSELLSGLDQGQCGVALVQLQDYDIRTDCELSRIGDPVFYIDEGVPVSRRARRLMAYLIKHKMIKGDWAEMMRSRGSTSRRLTSRARNVASGASTTAAISGTISRSEQCLSKENSKKKQMSVSSMLGTFVITGVMCLISLTSRCCTSRMSVKCDGASAGKTSCGNGTTDSIEVQATNQSYNKLHHMLDAQSRRLDALNERFDEQQRCLEEIRRLLASAPGRSNIAKFSSL